MRSHRVAVDKRRDKRSVVDAEVYRSSAGFVSGKRWTRIMRDLDGTANLSHIKSYLVSLF
jgi:hypothetical protein